MKDWKRDRDTYEQKDRQRDILTERQTERHTNRKTDRETYEQKDRQRDIQTERQTERHTNRKTDRKTYEQRESKRLSTERQTERHTNRKRASDFQQMCSPTLSWNDVGYKKVKKNKSV